MSSIQQPFRRISVTDQDLQQISHLLDTHEKEILNFNSDQVTRYFGGHHRTVFELKSFPQFIIKSGSNDQEMLRGIHKAAEIVEKQGLNRCFVPSVRLLETSGGKFWWVEEKLEGVFDSKAAKTVSEKEFELFDADPAIKQKWHEIFTQAVQAITLMGYWDFDWRNALLMSDGIGFIDFENPTPENLEQTAIGLYRLLLMAPPCCIDPIIDQIAKSEPKYLNALEQVLKDRSESIDTIKIQREKDLALHSQVRAFHATKVFSKESERVDASAYPKESWEAKIIVRFNKHMAYQDIATNSRDLVYFRSITYELEYELWSLFSSLPPAERSALLETEKTKFENALEQLKADKVIGGWKESSGHMKGYDIHF